MLDDTLTLLLVIGLGGLGYLLVTCVFYVLARHAYNATAVHDLVCESRRLRDAYEQQILEKSK